MLSEEEIHKRVTYHAPTELAKVQHARLSEATADYLRAIDDCVPDGREKSLAITNVEQAKMWASAGVARNQDKH